MTLVTLFINVYQLTQAQRNSISLHLVRFHVKQDLNSREHLLSSMHKILAQHQHNMLISSVT